MAKDLTDILDNDGKEELSRSKSRINELSDKVAAEAKAREEADAARKKAEADSQAAAKERDFYKSFSGQASKYTHAKEHEDAIKAKVLSGYTVEDATVSVLAAAGKLTSVESKPDKMDSVGGSAGTTVMNGGSKKPSEMTQAERLQALVDAEKSGEISMQ
jgi:hypothetical protein